MAEKMWIVRPVWRVDRRKIEQWHSLVKYHMYKGKKEAREWEYVPHFKVPWGWWSHSEVHIPLGNNTKIKVTTYWNLTTEKGWLGTYGAALAYIDQKCDPPYFTDIDPIVADSLIHKIYFPCFTDKAIRQAILGEKVLLCGFQRGHRDQVGTLQYLAIQAWAREQVKKHGRKSARGPHWGWRSRVPALVGQNAVRNKSGSQVTLPSRVHFPSLAYLCGTLA
ncbi:vif protein [Simian immunodeficiency virus]|uniref:Virion infectivity factor n=1 Tax=Simian immunodeficiency virus TaxID=11723 RepID=E1ANT9_SIV|nr:vif protein [Simian immunodeficiency virus]6P59_B Chain B, Virion infectivity factor [Simian immunodeficiency virus]6P59_F Chain F, Virion infectivity factor [Simian immunodeficiency virus]